MGDDSLTYARQCCLALKKDIDDFLESIGLSQDFWRAAQIAVGMETEVSRIRFCIEQFTDFDDYDHYHKAMEVHEVVELLMAEVINKNNINEEEYNGIKDGTICKTAGRTELPGRRTEGSQKAISRKDRVD